jgi:hypothetical protein
LIQIGEQPFDVGAPGRIAGERFGPDIAGQAGQVVDGARRKRHRDPFFRQHPRQRRAQARAGADDQCGVEFHVGHRRLLSTTPL